VFTGSVLLAFALALAYCAPPGPVLAEATRHGFSRGFRSALAVEIGSLAGDAFWLALALAGVTALAEVRGLGIALGAAGALLLLWLGSRALRTDGRMRLRASDTAPTEGGFMSGAAIGVANPYALPFWVAVGSSLSISSSGWVGYAVFFSAFMLACLAYALLISGAIAWGRRLLRPRLFFVVDVACGLALLAFGLRLLASTLGQALG
jgi:chemosensory pili system protein ChpE